MPCRLALLLPCAAFCLALSASPACAADDADDSAQPVAVSKAEGASPPLRELTTDRPDVTESPFTVDAGHIQLETTLFGYTRTADAADAYEFGTTNLRIGVDDRLEFDVVWQPYGILDPRGGGTVQRGIGSVDLRAKYNLWGKDGLKQPGDTALALLPYVTLPTDGENGIGESEVAFGLIVPLTVKLSDTFDLGLNAAANFTREDNDPTYDAAVLTSASLGHEWTDRLGSYAEVVWEFSRNDLAGDVVTLDTGVTYAIGEDWQLDAGVNIGATRAADDLVAFVGVSARF